MQDRKILNEYSPNFYSELTFPHLHCSKTSSCPQADSKQSQTGIPFLLTLNSQSSPIIKIRTSEQLENDFKNNKNIMESLNQDIDDLFKKISQLTDEVTMEINNKIQIDTLQIDQTKDILKHFSEQNDKRTDLSSKISGNQLIKPNKVQTKQNQKKQTREYHNLFSHFSQFDQIFQCSPKIRDFDIGKCLGHGKFGQVSVIKHKQTGAVYAVKKIFKSIIQEYKMQQQIYTQLKALKALNHQNIIKVYTAFSDEFHLFIILQLAFGTILTQKILSKQCQVKKIVKQLLQAIKHMHENNITHRDLKPQNIILLQNGQIKVCDLGWADIESENMTTLCGTLDYICPQMVKSSTYTKKIDLWNVGILTYELIFGQPPFKGIKSQLFEKVKNLDYLYPEQSSEECKNFINGYLKPESERQSLQWGLNHPFIKQEITQ